MSLSHSVFIGCCLSLWRPLCQSSWKSRIPDKAKYWTKCRLKIQSKCFIFVHLTSVWTAMTKHINVLKFAHYMQFSGSPRPTQWSHINVLSCASRKCKSGLSATRITVALFFQHATFQLTRCFVYKFRHGLRPFLVFWRIQNELSFFLLNRSMYSPFFCESHAIISVKVSPWWQYNVWICLKLKQLQHTPLWEVMLVDIFSAVG